MTQTRTVEIIPFSEETISFTDNWYSMASDVVIENLPCVHVKVTTNYPLPSHSPFLSPPVEIEPGKWEGLAIVPLEEAKLMEGTMTKEIPDETNPCVKPYAGEFKRSNS